MSHFSYERRQSRALAVDVGEIIAHVPEDLFTRAHAEA